MALRDGPLRGVSVALYAQVRKLDDKASFVLDLGLLHFRFYRPRNYEPHDGV